jgi:hypothetical protein
LGAVRLIAIAGHARRLSNKKTARHRHCERSEAIQPQDEDWIASSLRSSQ